MAAFRMLGDEITVPLPEGYCEPTINYEGVAEMMAASDLQNVTHLTLYACDEMAAGAPGRHYAIIKSPRAAMADKYERKELIDGLGDIPPSELTAALKDEAITRDASKSASQVTGVDMQIGIAIQPVDRDDAAFYMAGTGAAKAGGQTVVMSIAMAITVIKHHAMIYYFYAPGNSTSDVAAVLGHAKVEVRRLIKANGD